MDQDFTASQPDNGLVARAKAIILRPREEWPRIAGETTPPGRLLTSWVVPLAAIGPVASFIGQQLFGFSAFGITYRPGLMASLSTAVLSFVLTLVSVYVMAFVANVLSPRFGGRDDFPAAFRLVAYSMTAAWVAGIFGLVPALGILAIVGLYSLYLFYLGAEPVMGVPKDKALGYTALTVVAAILVYLAVGAVVAAVAGMSNAAGLAAAGSSDLAVDLGQYGNIEVDGERQTVDLGELGKVQIDGDRATVTIDGQEIEVPVGPPPGE